MSFSTLAWRGTVVFLLAGIMFLLLQERWSAADRARVLVATRDLPAFHVVQAGDVAVAAPKSAPPDALTTRNAAIGRHTLAAVEADAALTDGMIGALAPPGSQEWPVLTVVGGPRVTLGGRLARGDRVDLLLQALPQGPPVAPVRGAHVLDVREASTPIERSVTLAVPQVLDERQAAALAAGEVAVIRLPK